MHPKKISPDFWHYTLASLTIGFSTLGAIFSPAIAAPIANNFEIAQVRVRSRISPPTPLNLRPRTHIPLPTSNYHQYSRDRYYKYGSSHHRYRRYKPYYHKRYPYSYPRRERHDDRNIIIIISPNNKY